MLAHNRLEMKNRIIIKNAPAPTLEIDPEAEAVYIRFSRAKVARTIAEDTPRRGAVVTTDLDAKNNLVGVEIVGVKEFSIKAIRHALPEDYQKIDFERARFVPASSCPMETVPA